MQTRLVNTEEEGLLQTLLKAGASLEVAVHAQNAAQFVQALKALCNVPGSAAFYKATDTETRWMKFLPESVGNQEITVFFPEA